LEGAAGGGGGGSKGGSKGGKRLEQVEGEFEGLQPGLLSQELRQVLGIGEPAHAAVPWSAAPANNAAQQEPPCFA
jgi:hypothetical protein